MEFVGGLIGSIGGKIIDTIDRSNERDHEINKINTSGRVQKELIEAKGNIELKKAEIDGRYGIENKKLDNAREKEKEDHLRKIKDLDNQYNLDKLDKDYKHELDLLANENEKARLAAENERAMLNTVEENKRKMKELDGELANKNLELTAKIEEGVKKLNLEELKVV